MALFKSSISCIVYLVVLLIAGIKIAECNYGFVHFSLHATSFYFMYFEALLSGAEVSRIVMSFGVIGPLL
jgi:hypothetical protein